MFLFLTNQSSSYLKSVFWIMALEYEIISFLLFIWGLFVVVFFLPCWLSCNMENFLSEGALFRKNKN